MTTSFLLQIVLGALLAAVTAFLSHRLRLLTIGGSLAQFGVGWLLFGLGAWQWGAPIVVFFLLSSVLSRLTDLPSRPGSDLFAKGGTRDELQVAANGGLAALLVVPWVLTGREVFFVGYLGAVAASAADTWATEVGMTSLRAPRSLRTLRAIVPGQSGGVTARGLLAAAMGGAVIVLAGLPWLEVPGAAAVAVWSAAFLACLLDSLLGATIQLQYRCPACGRFSERPMHCGMVAEHASGRPWLTNDTVNVVASTTAGVAAVLLYRLFTGSSS